MTNTLHAGSPQLMTAEQVKAMTIGDHRCLWRVSTPVLHPMTVNMLMKSLPRRSLTLSSIVEGVVAIFFVCILHNRNVSNLLVIVTNVYKHSFWDVGSCLRGLQVAG